MKKICAKTEYEVTKLIAEGGMGAVYQARLLGAEGFEKIVAIKTLLEKYADDKIFVERFIAEAKLVANLIHENIVQTYQLNRDRRTYYFVLEYVDGISLFDLMEFHRKIKRRLPVELAVFIVSRVARGLAYAHSRCDGNGRPLNIVHCDVCPHNILINVEGVPKLTDFGIAKAAHMNFDQDRVAGKAAFMAPEQATRGQKIDFRADIYSLGIVLFYLLSGTYTRHLDRSLPDILQEARQNKINWELLPKDLSVELMKILQHMLATDPEDRYGDTRILAQDLEYFIYKDGYGPTIVTLANYMRALMPGRFGLPDPLVKIPGFPEDSVQDVFSAPPETTLVMTEEELNTIGAGKRQAKAHDGKTTVMTQRPIGNAHDGETMIMRNPEDEVEQTIVLPRKKIPSET